MDTLADIRQAVQDDLTIGTESSLFTTSITDRAINRAYRRIGGMYRWPETEDAKKTSTEANQEYYDYPDNWRPDSIWKLEVDGEDLGDPLIFRDYLYEKENDFPNGEDNIWSNQWRRYFILIDGAAPTSNGNNNISVWGCKVVDELTLDADTTIFSYSLPECNDAIALEAEAILKRKGDSQNNANAGALISLEAKAIVTGAWNKIKQENAKYERSQPFFDVPDLFGRNRRRQNTGNFD